MMPPPLSYDTRDRVTQATSPSGTSSATYTADNKQSTGQDELGNQSTFSYNTNNDQTQATAPQLAPGQTAPTFTATYNTPSTVTGYLYLPSSVTDPQGNCTAYVYDTSGRVTDTYQGQTSPCDGRTGGVHTSTQYQGDTGVNCGGKAGEVCASVTGNGGTTSYAYDSNGNLTSVTPPSPLGAITITNDPLSRTSTITDGKSQKTTLSYDALDRLTQVLYNGATTCTPNNGNCISYSYD